MNLNKPEKVFKENDEIDNLNKQVNNENEEKVEEKFKNLKDGILKIEKDGMVSYVADDLETKLKNSSPKKNLEKFKKNENKNFFQPDILLLEEIENEAESIAISVNLMMKKITVFLNQISKLTTNNVINYNKYINSTCDLIDSNIKKMYQIMAKCEELSIQMTPIENLQLEIEKINKLLDLLDKELDSKPA